MKTQKIFILSSHYEEDLNWLINQKEYDYLIYSKNKNAKEIINAPEEKIRIIENRGMEATSYIRFILDFYENIPDYVAFCHGHESAWHQHSDILSIIKSYNLNDEYFTLNNPYYRNCLYDDCPQEISYPADKRVWNKIKSLKSELMIELPDLLEITMGAQFIIKKENILRHKKPFYENILRWLNTQEEMTESAAGIIIEQLWYLIFTGKKIEPRLIRKTIMSQRGYVEN